MSSASIPIDDVISIQAMIATLCLILLGLALTVTAGLVAFTAFVARTAEKKVPPVGRYITLDGVRLHYVDEGEGPVILLIHGLASQVQSFTYALSPLLRERYRLIILDRPGNGYSQAAPSAGLRAQADLIAAFVRTLDIQRALVAGHSLGGAIALALAIEHPDCVSGLALIAPLTQYQDEVPKALKGLALRLDITRFLIGWTVAVPASIIARDTTLEALFSPDPVAPHFGTRGGAMLPLRPWAFRHASQDLVDVSEELSGYSARHHELRVPVGVLFGTGDQILDYRRHGEGLKAQLPGVDLEIVDGGHMLPLTQPQTAAAFIDRIAARAYRPMTDPKAI